MDILDAIGIGADLKGKLGRLFGLVGFLLILGWAKHWPVAYPLVQAAYEGRVEQMTDVILSAIPSSSS